MMSALAALGLTLAVEAPLVAWAGRRLQRTWGRVLLAGLLPSLLTHPLAWRAWERLGPQDYQQGVAIIEIAVWLVEALLLKLILRLQWRQALLLSLLANAASFAAGWIF